MEFPEVPNNSFRTTLQTKRTEIKDYSVLPTGTESVTASKEKRKGKLLSLILPEDIPDIETYLQQQGVTIFKSIILPKIRDILMDSFSSILGGGSRSTQSSINSISRVSYDSKYRNVGSNSVRNTSSRSIERPFYEDIGFSDPEIADQFMAMVEDLYTDQEGFITVAQFYNIANRSTTPEQSNYGWTSINGMKRVYSHGTYYIDMTYPVPLN